jgi:hypothetical protein
MKACGSSKVLIAFECFSVVLIRRLMKKQHIHTYIHKCQGKSIELEFQFWLSILYINSLRAGVTELGCASPADRARPGTPGLAHGLVA